jgi:hypothetical protein
VIEEVRVKLAPDVQAETAWEENMYRKLANAQADSEWEEYIYRKLRDPWTGQEGSKRQNDPTPAAIVPKAATEPETAKQFRGGAEGGVTYSKRSRPPA